MGPSLLRAIQRLTMHRAWCLAAVLAAAYCSSSSACDNLADLMGRLSVETAPRPRAASAFLSPGFARLQVPGMCRRREATQGCRRASTFTLGSPLVGGLAAGQGMSAGMGSFWSGVEAQGNARSAVSSLVMRSTKSKQSPRTTVSSKTSRPSGIVQKPSHQVRVARRAARLPLSHGVFFGGARVQHWSPGK